MALQIIPIGRSTFYYNSATSSNLVYTSHSFGFDSTTVIFVNDSGTSINVSFDGVTLAGEIKDGETVTFSGIKKSKIYERGSVGAEAFRIWAY